jgi:hypothetical protein
MSSMGLVIVLTRVPKCPEGKWNRVRVDRWQSRLQGVSLYLFFPLFHLSELAVKIRDAWQLDSLSRLACG